MGCSFSEVQILSLASSLGESECRVGKLGLSLGLVLV